MAQALKLQRSSLKKALCFTVEKPFNTEAALMNNFMTQCRLTVLKQCDEVRGAPP